MLIAWSAFVDSGGLYMFKDIKITVFGDSIGKGVFTDGGKIEVLKNNAVDLFSAWSGIEIDNRSGYGQSLKRLVERGFIKRYITELDKTKRNAVVIELGGNDADFDWRAVAADPESEHLPKTSVGEFGELYREVINEFKANGVMPVVCTIVPISSERYFENVISKTADGAKVMEYFKGDFNTIHRHQEMFNNEILKNAFGAGVKVIDLRREFLNSNEFEGLICRDGIHPNALGQEKIFEAARDFARTA